MDKLIEAGGVLRNAKLFIDDTPGQGMLRIAANARRLKLRHEHQAGRHRLFAADRAGQPPRHRARSRWRRSRAGSSSWPASCKSRSSRWPRSTAPRRIGRTTGRAWPTCANRARIEQDADTVMLLHRPELYEPGQHEGIVEVIVAKQRNGPTGEITLTYLKQFMRFENFAVGIPFELRRPVTSALSQRRRCRYNLQLPLVAVAIVRRTADGGSHARRHRTRHPSAGGRPAADPGRRAHRAPARPGRPQRRRRGAARRHRRPARRRRPGRHRRRLSRHRPGASSDADSRPVPRARRWPA